HLEFAVQGDHAAAGELDLGGDVGDLAIAHPEKGVDVPVGGEQSTVALGPLHGAPGVAGGESAQADRVDVADVGGQGLGAAAARKDPDRDVFSGGLGRSGGRCRRGQAGGEDQGGQGGQDNQSSQ